MIFNLWLFRLSVISVRSIQAVVSVAHTLISEWYFTVWRWYYTVSVWSELGISAVGSSVWPPHSQLVLLFGKVVEPLRGALLEEVSHYGWALRNHRQSLLPAVALVCFLSVDAVRSDSPCSWHRAFPATSSPPWWTAFSGTHLSLP